MSSHRRYIESSVYPPMNVGPTAYYEGGGTEQGSYGYSLDAEIGFMEAAEATPTRVGWRPVRETVAQSHPSNLSAEFMVYDLIDAQRGGGSDGYGITTNLRESSKTGGGILAFLDYMVGGYEEEDIAASPTSGGIDTRTGKPMDPNAARSVAESIGKPDYNPYDDYDPNAPEKKPDVKKLVIVAGGLVGAFALWKFVVEPRLAKKPEGSI